MSSVRTTSIAILALGLVACGNGGTSEPAATKDSAAKAPERGASASPETSASPPLSPPSAAPAPAASNDAPLPAASPGASPQASAAHGAPSLKPVASTASSASPASSASSASSSAGARGPAAGKPWQLVASADADAGYHCNPDYPNKLTTTGGTNVTYPDPKPRGACVGNRVVVNVPIVPTAAGPGTVVGTLSYGICDDAKTSCLIRKKDVTLSFVATP